MSAIRSAVTTPSVLGECPLWSANEQVLYWLDIDGKLVHRFDPAMNTDLTRSLPARPGSIALTSTVGQLLVAMEHELVWLDWSTGALLPFIEVTTPSPDRLNDGRTDPAGRFVVGSLQSDPTLAPSQRVHQVSSTGASSVSYTHLTLPTKA